VQNDRVQRKFFCDNIKTDVTTTIKLSLINEPILEFCLSQLPNSTTGHHQKPVQFTSRPKTYFNKITFDIILTNQFVFLNTRPYHIYTVSSCLHVLSTWPNHLIDASTVSLLNQDVIRSSSPVKLCIICLYQNDAFSARLQILTNLSFCSVIRRRYMALQNAFNMAGLYRQIELSRFRGC